MEILMSILLILHIIGIAGLFGGWFLQISKVVRGTAVIPAGMVHAGWLALVAGILMFGVVEMTADPTMDLRIKLTVKLLIAAVIMVLLMLNKKKDPAPSSIMWLVGGLTLANIVIAVVW